MPRDMRTVAPRKGTLAGQVFDSPSAYRAALARASGFETDYQRRQALRLQKERETLARLSTKQLRTRQKALEAVTYLRRGETNLSDAARRAGTTPETVKRYASQSLIKRKGAYRARGRDRALRAMSFFTPTGKTTVWVRSSADASLIAKHADAIRHYVSTGDDSRLRAFRDRFIIDADGKRWDFMMNKLALKRLGNAGELSFESIYASAA